MALSKPTQAFSTTHLTHNASTQGQRIEAYCKIIWGADRSFDIEIEDCGEDFWLGFIREDRVTSYGNALVFTPGAVEGQDSALNKLEGTVAKMAKAVLTEGWVPKVQPLDEAAYSDDWHVKYEQMDALCKRAGLQRSPKETT